MQEIVINPLTRWPSRAQFRAAVERTATRRDLRVTWMGSPKQYPGSQHGHLRWPKRGGTLEVTRWPQKRRLWVSLYRGREGSWAFREMAPFALALARALGSHPESRRGTRASGQRRHGQSL